MSDILDKKWFGGLYHLHHTQDNWQQWLTEFEPDYQYPLCDIEKMEKIFCKNLGHIRDRAVADLACNLGYLGLAASNLGAKKVLGLEVRPEYVDTFHRFLQHWTIKNISVLQCNIEDLDILSEYLSDIDTIIYAGHFYHTINHRALLKIFTSSPATCVILESIVPDKADPDGYQYRYDDVRDPLNGYIDDVCQQYRVAAPTIEKTQELLTDLGWTVRDCEIIGRFQPKRYVITAIRSKK